MQLGEVYTHLLPTTGDPQAIADSAFREAHRLDQQATYALFHLIELRLRQRDLTGARPMIRQFAAARPDPSLSRQIELMEACTERGAAAMDWRGEAKRNRLPIIAAAKLFAAAGARLDCAEPTLAAVIEADTTEAGDARWFAVLQLQAVLLAQGRTDEAMRLVDARPTDEAANVMYLLDAPVFPEVGERAAEVASRYKLKCGLDYARCSNPFRIWELGVWYAHRFRSTEADFAASELAARAKRAGDANVSALAGMLARSVAAHAALARADTATAFRLLEASVDEPVPSGETLEWDLGRPRGLDRLRLAELLFARGEAERALEVADVLDSTAPSVYLLYLPESLRLRAEAARALGDGPRAKRYQDRLAALRGGGTPPVSGQPQKEVT